MEQVIVDQDNTIAIETTQNEAVVVDSQQSTIVVTGLMGPPGIDSPQGIATLTDVDLTNLQNGSLLVYNQQTQTWIATRSLDNQIIEAGQF